MKISQSWILAYNKRLDDTPTLASGSFIFDIEKVLDEADENLEIFCRLIFEGRDLASKIDSYIFVRTTGARR